MNTRGQVIPGGKTLTRLIGPTLSRETWTNIGEQVSMSGGRSTPRGTSRGRCAGTYLDLDDLRMAVRAFVERYNTQWLIERHGHRTPRETYALAMQVVAA